MAWHRKSSTRDCRGQLGGDTGEAKGAMGRSWSEAKGAAAKAPLVVVHWWLASNQ